LVMRGPDGGGPASRDPARCEILLGWAIVMC
jgi:hypothetical protein